MVKNGLPSAQWIKLRHSFRRDKLHTMATTQNFWRVALQRSTKSHLTLFSSSRLGPGDHALCGKKILGISRRNPGPATIDKPAGTECHTCLKVARGFLKAPQDLKDELFEMYRLEPKDRRHLVELLDGEGEEAPPNEAA